MVISPTMKDYQNHPSKYNNYKKKKKKKKKIVKKKTKIGKRVPKYKLKVKWVHMVKQAMRSQLINTPQKKKKPAIT